jgi:tetratricopeptide (TPR) repeat protein
MADKGLVELMEGGEQLFRFTHLTTQEVVYESLSFELKRDLHCRIGTHYEDTHAETLDEWIDLLAYHYYEGHVWPKAATYNLQAGRRAQREYANEAAEYANEAAISALRKVLEAAKKLESLEETNQAALPAHEMMGEVMTLIGQYQQALENLDLASKLAEATPDPSQRARQLAELNRKTADVYERQSEYERAHKWLDEGLGYLELEKPSIEAVRIHILKAGVYFRQGRFDEAIARGEVSLSLARNIDSREGMEAIGQSFYLIGVTNIELGNLERAVALSSESVQVYQAIDHVVGQAKAYNNLGIAYTDMGKWSLAVEALEHAQEIFQKIGEKQEQGFVTNNLGNIYLYRGEWDRAAESFKESNDVWKQLGAEIWDAVSLSNLAQVYISSGSSLTDALECLTESERLLKKCNSDGFLPELERRWAEFYLRKGDAETALQHVTQSIELASRLEASIELGMSNRVLGKVRLALGEFELAKTAFTRSLKILKHLKSHYEAAKTELAIAQWSLDSGSRLDRKALDRAKQVFMELGAQADLDVARQLRDTMDATTD